MCRRCSEHISGLIAEEKEEFTEDPQHTCETAVALSTDVPFDVSFLQSTL